MVGGIVQKMVQDPTEEGGWKKRKISCGVIVEMGETKKNGQGAARTRKDCVRAARCLEKRVSGFVCNKTKKTYAWIEKQAKPISSPRRVWGGDTKLVKMITNG